MDVWGVVVWCVEVGEAVWGCKGVVREFGVLGCEGLHVVGIVVDFDCGAEDEIFVSDCGSWEDELVELG